MKELNHRKEVLISCLRAIAGKKLDPGLFSTTSLCCFKQKHLITYSDIGFTVPCCGQPRFRFITPPSFPYEKLGVGWEALHGNDLENANPSFFHLFLMTEPQLVSERGRGHAIHWGGCSTNKNI